MTPENSKFVIQCSSCSANLRVGANAKGKTIECPKCGHRMMIDDRLRLAEGSVVARPVSSSSIPNPVVAQPYHPSAGMSQPAASSDWNQIPLPPSQPTNYGQSNRMIVEPRGGQVWLWIALGGAGLLFVGVFVSVAVLWLSKGMQVSDVKGDNKAANRGNEARPNDTVDAGGNRANANPNVSLGPDLPFKEGILFYRVTVARLEQQPLNLNIFIPKGNHAARSLPVMLEAPSGTNLLHGAGVEMPLPSTEYLPFTDLGMITVTFSIDGEMPRNLSPAEGPIYMQQLKKAYKEFVQSDAGVNSGKLALDFVLENIPAADSNRVYMWGHSSSATLALLMASKDKRIAKCIALAPITNLHLRLEEVRNNLRLYLAFPGLMEYMESGSPISHVRDLKCPVFLAHAKDDDNEPFKHSQGYVKALQAAGGNVVFEAPEEGGHYKDLIDASIPKAITWLNETR